MYNVAIGQNWSNKKYMSNMIEYMISALYTVFIVKDSQSQIRLSLRIGGIYA